MRRFYVFSLYVLTMFVVTASGVQAQDYLVNRSAAQTFAVMPTDAPFPEGITVNPDNGDIYVGTFNGIDSKLLRYNKSAQLIGKTDGLGAPIVGLAFGSDGKVYYCYAGSLVGSEPKIKRIDANLDESSIEDVVKIPLLGLPSDRIAMNLDGSTDIITFGNYLSLPNALAFHSSGDLFVSDSFQGAIFKITKADDCDASSCAIHIIVHDGLLATAGIPAVGANGLALLPTDSNNPNMLFIANTGDDRILNLNLATGELNVFVENINGADGIVFDTKGQLWVAANQEDAIVGLSGTGRVVAKLGDFLGIRKDGSAKGLIFPASMAIYKGDFFVTNLALDFADSDIETSISTYTVSRIKIP